MGSNLRFSRPSVERTHSTERGYQALQDLPHKTLRSFEGGNYLRVHPGVSVLDLSLGSSFCILGLGSYDEYEWEELFY